MEPTIWSERDRGTLARRVTGTVESRLVARMAGCSRFQIVLPDLMWVARSDRCPTMVQARLCYLRRERPSRTSRRSGAA